VENNMMDQWGDRSFFSLEVLDFDTEPALVTQRLGINPTYVRIKGEKNGNRVNRRSMWVHLSQAFTLENTSELKFFADSLRQISIEGIRSIERFAKIKLCLVIETTDKNKEIKIPHCILSAAARLELDVDLDIFYFDEKDMEEYKTEYRR
jgi:hypothetical protein